MNTLVLRVELDGEVSFRAAIARAREAALGAYAHQDVPFEQVVAELAPERDLSRSPLFQVMLTLQSPGSRGGPRHEAPGGDPRLAPTLALRPAAAPATTAKLDLFLSLVEGEGGLAGAFEYATDLFDAGTIERLVERLRGCSRRWWPRPDRPVGDIEVILPDERRRLLEAWSGTVVDAAGGATVPDLFEAQAEATPDAIAVTHAGEEISYGELGRRADQLAAFLRARGVGPDVPVGICLARGVPLVLAILAVFKAGGAYLSLDPEYPADRLAFMLADARPPVLLTQASLAGAPAAPGAEVVHLDTAWERVAAVASTRPSREALRPGCLAYLVYTSGSTGKPKGVAMTHRPLVNLIRWQRAVSPGALRTLQFASPSFDVCFQELFSTWASGGALVLVGEETRRDPERLLRHLDEARVERLFAPPVALYQLAEAARAGGDAPRGLREVIAAGEALQIGPRSSSCSSGRAPRCATSTAPRRRTS